MSKTIEPIAARGVAYVALYPGLCQIARNHGYALGVHGSVSRDFDLIAVPWIPEAEDPLTLVKAMKEWLRAVTHNENADEHYPECNPSKRPHGRTAYSLHCSNNGMYAGYIDLSVMPREPIANISSPLNP